MSARRPTPPPPGPRRRAATPPPARRHPALAGLVGFALVLLLPLAAALVVRAANSGKILPGTQVAGIDVGGLDRAEARAELAPRLGAERTITIVGPDEELTTTTTDAGLTVDLDETVQRAFDAGRDGTLAGLPSTLGGLVTSRDVEPVTRVDAASLGREVAAVADAIDRDAFPGELKIDASSLLVELQPPRTGRTVDRGVLADRLRRALRSTDDSRVQAPVDVRRVVPRDQAEAVARAAEEYLRTPLRLTGAGEPLEVSGEELAGILALESLENRTRARLGAGDTRLATLAETLAKRRDRPARNARIVAPRLPGTLVEGKGEVTFRPREADIQVEGDGRPGRRVDRKALAVAIEEAIRANEHTARIPTSQVKPDVSRDAARSVTDLIGTFTTRYQPGQPRVTNIRTAAKAVDGTIVAPGGTFSLNGTTGERTLDKGYVAAPFIADNRIVDSVGGGVSQLSTTVYNAAYFAGLPIEAFRAHSLFIDRYPAGREATLNFPDIDLRWRNDTDAPILVRAATDETSVTVSLYGDNGGRRVTAKPGARRPVEGRNFAITVTREIRYEGGRTERQPTTITYDNPRPEPEDEPAPPQADPAPEPAPAG